MKTETATFGAGCLWGVEAAIQEMAGVVDTAVGYMGGVMERPSYEEVCTDKTGHVEVTQVAYDPDKVSYNTLLETFWNIHNPTQEDGQGLDFGTQYRSVIFYHTEEQKRLAEESRDMLEMSKKYSQPIVTTIEPAQTFWRAEAYHQRYHEKHGGVC